MTDIPAARVAKLRVEIAACTRCAALPLGPRPLVQFSATARLLIIGQAPGRLTHLAGVPWDDASGARLRDWLGLGPEPFYDPARVALLPMGLCYPGRAASGDLPPVPHCAPFWHPRVLAAMADIRLTLLVGAYAQAAYCRADRSTRDLSMTERVRAADNGLGRTIALPHPSWRVVGWMRRNPWFERETLPRLRGRVAAALAD